MNKFLLVFYGGKMAATPAEQKKSMDAWMAWYGSLGKAVVDAGNPTVPGKIVGKTGVKSVGAGPVTGYSILQGNDLDAVVKMAKSCPIIAGGGEVAVYPIMAMM